MFTEAGFRRLQGAGAPVARRNRRAKGRRPGKRLTLEKGLRLRRVVEMWWRASSKRSLRRRRGEEASAMRRLNGRTAGNGLVLGRRLLRQRQRRAGDVLSSWQCLQGR